VHHGLAAQVGALVEQDIATAAVGANIQIAAYDIDPHTLGPDLATLVAVARQKPSAVVIAHLYGIPVDLDSVREICQSEGIPLIEDAAQGHGAAYAGKSLGSFGSVSILSFGRGKGVTGGTGGALLALDDRGIDLLRDARLRLGSPARGTTDWIAALAQWILARPSVYSLPASLPFLKLGETIYRAPSLPRQIAQAAAAVLTENWDASEVESEIRKANAARLMECAGGSEEIATIRIQQNAEAGYLRFPVVAAAGIPTSFDSATARHLGIMPAYPRPLVDLSDFANRCVNCSAAFPGARLLAERLYTIPTHSKLSATDLQGIEILLRAGARASQ